MDVVVFGAGALGSLIGGLLAREHAVALVGRTPHIEAIADRGLRLIGGSETTVHPRATTALDTDAELAVVTTKSFDTETAARALATREIGAALSLQNGMGNEETLAAHLDCPVLGGATTFGALFREPGVVECTGVGDVVLGAFAGPKASHADREAARRAGDAFESAGIDAEVVADVRPRLWEKLAVNAGINPVTALCRLDNGCVREPPARAVATQAAAEVAAVATDRGIELGGDVAREAVLAVAGATAANRSSMRADVEAGRRTEIDAINGYVVEVADRPVPTNETLCRLVRAWEAGQGLR